MKYTRIHCVLMFGAVALAACGGGSSSSGPVLPVTVTPLQGTGTIKSVGAIAQGADACSALEATIKSMASSQIRMQFAAYAVPVWYPGYGSGGILGGTGSISPAVIGTAVSAPAANTASVDSAYSKTNIQYAGVDEMDWVKNDDHFLWTFASQSAALTLTKSALTPAASMQRVAQTQWSQSPSVNGLGNWLSPEGLFMLKTGQVASVSSGGSAYGIYWGDVAIAGAMTPVYPGPLVAVPPYTELRVHDGDTLATTRTYKIKGRLLAARHLSAGDALVFVTEAPVVWPAGIKWYPDVSVARSQSELTQMWSAALQSTLDANLALIAAQPLASWLGEESAPTAAECAGFARVDAENHLAMTRVTTIVPATQSVVQTVLLTEGSGVYVSPTSVVLSTRRWAPADGNPWQDAWTDLHRFSLNAQGVATYQASGRIAGWLLNRFAMDETQQDGRTILRLAVSNRSISAGAPGISTQPYSYLVSLEQKAGSLVQAAISDPIAPGESLQSARFVGDKAYLVTFRVVDPFFIYDLSKPDQIVAKGELKVPGYSTYLHPISDKLIFGLGLDSGSWPRRVKASLFDVSNPAVPVEVGTLALGDSNSWSEALWEPHALTFYPVTAAGGSKSTLVGVPVGADIKLLHIADAGSLTLQGTMSLGSLYSDYARRSVFVGDKLYGLTQNRLSSAAFAAPGLTLGILMLQP